MCSAGTPAGSGAVLNRRAPTFRRCGFIATQDFAGTVKVTGTLSPAEGGEEIAVMYRDKRVWRSRSGSATTPASALEPSRRGPGPVKK